MKGVHKRQLRTLLALHAGVLTGAAAIALVLWMVR